MKYKVSRKLRVYILINHIISLFKLILFPFSFFLMFNDMLIYFPTPDTGSKSSSRYHT